MKLFSILITSFLFFMSCDSRIKSNDQLEDVNDESATKEIIEMIADRLLVKPVYVLHNPIMENIDTEEMEQELESKSEFSKIVSQIPITPLPFGISNLDEIDLSLSPRSVLDAPIDFDKENVYGLNDFFEKHEELDPFVEHDGRCMPYRDDDSEIYFSRRFPNLKTGEIVLLYYHIKPQKTRIGIGNGESYIEKWFSQRWFILVCDPSGKTRYVDTSILSADEYMRLSYIDESYVIRTKHYQFPALRSLVSDRTPDGEIDEVSDEVKRAKLTTLFHESFYKLQKPKDENYFSEMTGRWHACESSLSLPSSIQYQWKDNKPVEFKRY